MPLETGSRFPELLLSDLDGQRVAPVDAATVLWCVYKTECPTCALTFPFWRELATAAAPDGLRLVAVAQNTADEVEEFVGALPDDIDLRLDDEPYQASRDLGVQVTPTVFLVEDGTVTTVIEAWQSEAYQALARHLGDRLGLPAVPSPDGFPPFQYG